MGKIEILGKIDDLLESIFISKIKKFEQRDVVYLLVEIYKIKEREFGLSGKKVKKEFRYISFFRDWVVHTHLNNNEWFEEKKALNNPGKLLTEIISVIENEDTVSKLTELWPTFENALSLVTENQDIFKK